jgi:hypothetical protein
MLRWCSDDNAFSTTSLQGEMSGSTEAQGSKENARHLTMPGTVKLQTKLD